MARCWQHNISGIHFVAIPPVSAACLDAGFFLLFFFFLRGRQWERGLASAGIELTSLPPDEAPAFAICIKDGSGN